MPGERASDGRPRAADLSGTAAGVLLLLLTAAGAAAGAPAAGPSGAGVSATLASWLDAVPRAAWYWTAAGLIASALAGATAALLMGRRRGLERSPTTTVAPSARPGTAPPATGGTAVARWELVGWDGAGGGLRASFGPLDLARAGDGLVLGRNPELCHFVVGNTSVSRRHVRFTIKDGALMVEDLNSTNGTLLEGQRLAPMKPARLRDGDTLVLGDFFVRLADRA